MPYGVLVLGGIVRQIERLRRDHLDGEREVRFVVLLAERSCTRGIFLWLAGSVRPKMMLQTYLYLQPNTISVIFGREEGL